MVVDESQTNFDLQWFLSNCHIYKYPSKSTLIHQGEKAETLFYIIEGIVSVFIKDNEGKEIVLYLLSKGDFIGESGLFEKIKKRKYWVKAKTSCDIAEISYKNFHHLIKVNTNILFYLAHKISKRLQVIKSEKIKDLEFLRKMGIVAQILLNLAKKSNSLIHLSGKKIQTTNQEIAKKAGFSENTIIHILRILKEQYLIDIIDNNIIIYGPLPY